MQVVAYADHVAACNLIKDHGDRFSKVFGGNAVQRARWFSRYQDDMPRHTDKRQITYKPVSVAEADLASHTLPFELPRIDTNKQGLPVPAFAGDDIDRLGPLIVAELSRTPRSPVRTLTNVQFTNRPPSAAFGDPGSPCFILEDAPPWSPLASMGCHQELRQPSAIDPEAIVVTRGGEDNYAHFLLRKIPLLVAAAQLETDIPIYVPQGLTALDLAVLGAVNIDATRYVDASVECRAARVGHLIDLEWAQTLSAQTVQNAMTKTSGGRSSLIYISRKNAPARRMKNELELEDALVKLGFKVVTAEHHSYSEQIKIFSEAGTIVGPHGAGLTNMIFASPGCRIVEIFPPFYWNNPSMALQAKRSGHKYSPIIGSPGETVESWTCDVQRVVDSLTSLSLAPL